MRSQTLAAIGRRLAHRPESGSFPSATLSSVKAVPLGTRATTPPQLHPLERQEVGSFGAQSAEVLPPLVENPLLDFAANTAPLEIWEGTVISVDLKRGFMEATLDACMSSMPMHTAEFDLEWVSDQDMDLVRPGAVFYLTLFKRSKPSIENAQELRFRRRPAWTKGEIQQIDRNAREILKKGKEAPLAKL